MAHHYLYILPFILLFTSSSHGEIYFKKGAPQVALSGEKVLSGKLDFSREGRPFTSFLGVPYATVPERFGEAQLIQEPTWEGIFKADQAGNKCVQPLLGAPKPAAVGEEDCLNLNVYVPMNNTQRKGGYNVMVWVHGGGFVLGDGYGYGPKYFMDEDIILVTLNYRLGVFGFLSTGDEVIPGNYGLKDMVVALKWIQENIRKFGGDPGKVTVFGESAGGAAVHYLLLSPTTKGLFRNAISQSGSALSPWAYFPDPKSFAVKLATHLKCPTTAADPSQITSQQIATCLKGLSKEALGEAEYTFNPGWPASSLPLQFGPVKETSTAGTPFITKSPLDILADNSVPLKEVPWMIGMNEDEGCSLYAGHVLKIKQLEEDLESNWSNIILRALELYKFFKVEDQERISNKIREFYFKDKKINFETRENLTNLYSDSFFVAGVRQAAVETAQRSKKSRVYLYEYAHVGPASFMNILGYPMAEEELKKVGHADDLLLQFNVENITPAAENIIKPDSEHEKFSKNFVKLWVSFAIHGKPKYSWGTSTDLWRPISTNGQGGKATPLKWFKLSSNPAYIDDHVEERALFWEKLFNDYSKSSFTAPSASKTKTEL